MRSILLYMNYFLLILTGLLMTGNVEAFSISVDDYEQGPLQYCPALSRTMKFGARDIYTNGEVSELQRFLAAWFDRDEEGLVTGYFGRTTRSLVVSFNLVLDYRVMERWVV